MATRFYFDTASSAVSPAFDAGWEQTGQAIRGQLRRKTTLSTLMVLAGGTNVTVPITTTQDILCAQFVSDPLPGQLAIGTIALIMKAIASSGSTNTTLALVIKTVSNDGGTVTNTLFSSFSIDTVFGVTGQTRILTTSNITTSTINTGDRLVVEMGAHAAAPTISGTYQLAFGDNNAADYALTSGLTTNLNPWCELSQNLWDGLIEDYRYIRVGNGMSTTERVR